MRLLPALALAACAGGSSEPQDPTGRLLIEEVYYSGAVPAAGVDHYYSDQFVQIENTSRDVVGVGGLMIGDAAGIAGEINPGSLPDGFRDSRPNRVVLENVWRVPGAFADVTLEPGESLLIAHDGTNHQPMSTLDLTGASFETYVEVNGGDDDHPLVPNLEPVHFTGGYDWLVTVFGPSLVVLRPGAELMELDDGFWEYRTASVNDVVDGVDALMDGSSRAYKRLPDAVDAGFTHVSGTYTGESVKRVRVDGELQDTNDSSMDFEVGDPDPYGG
ncbi:MAG: DUF4876 domain-containing protein [Alphaproteobacteria bacterium]|nr:DUF4876 domain-containing protein [Alphaproteobacteria bacterium]